MSATAKTVLDVAKGWVGYSVANGKYKEIIDLYNSHKPLASNYKVQYGDAWCDTFVSAVAIKAGAVDIIGTECSCERHIAIFKNKGIWNEDGTITPKAGDLILWNWDDSTQPNDGWADHIGYVEYVDSSGIHTIEGNCSNAVSRRTLNIGNGYIRGFARPKYSGTVVAETPVQTTPSSNGTKSINDIIAEVIAGKWGYGAARKSSLTSAGYNYEEIQNGVNKLLSGVSNPTVSSPTTTKSMEEIAKEVITGKWGNGADRKNAIVKAGYDYAAVQKKVNELL